MKLGKRPHVPDGRDVTLAALAAAVPIPKPPSRFGHGYAFSDWGMLGNDNYGDCVFAGAAHETMLTTKLGGHTAEFDDSSVLGDYSAVTGFDPNDPNTDQGTETRVALKYRRATGVADAAGKRHKIGAYVALNPGDYDQLMEAVFAFTAVGMGFEFPQSAMDQFNKGLPWSVVAGSPIEGGHYVPVVGRTSSLTGACVTWGKRQAFSRKFYETYADEAWAIVYPEELKNGKTEHGYDLAALNTLLREL